MKTIAILTSLLAAVLLTSPAYSGEQQATDRDALREEMRQARRDLAEAARRVAELGRELGQEWDEGTPRAFAFNMFHENEKRAMLGVTIGEDSEDSKGAEVLSVTPGGPADKAGIRAGDVIVKLGDAELAKAKTPSHTLIETMRELEPGETVTVSYRRGTDQRETEVAVEAFRPHFAFLSALDGLELPLAPFPPHARFLDVMRPWGDIELAAMSPELGEYFGTDEGLLVVRAPDEEGFQLRDGDVILRIGGRAPEDAAHAMRILGSYRPGEKVTLDIVRQRKKQSLEIALPEQRMSMRATVRAPRAASR